MVRGDARRSRPARASRAIRSLHDDRIAARWSRDRTVGARSVVEGDVRDSVIWDDCDRARRDAGALHRRARRRRCPDG